MRANYLLFLLSILPIQTMAQNFHFEKITEQNGLSDNRVTCFQKDRTGFMWIGTQNGLNRYDGHTFQIYKPGQKRFKLSHEHINDVEEDAQGRLWVATWHGLNVIDPKNDSLHIFLPDEDGAAQQKTRIASNLTWDSHIDKRGRVWLALDVRDLCYYDPAQKEFTYLPWRDFVKANLPQYKNAYKSIHKIIAKSDHELWLGTTLGLFSYDINTQAFHYHGGDAPEDFIAIHYDSIRQEVYFAQRKLYTYDLQQNSLQEIKQSKITISSNLKSPSSLLLPSLNGLWVVDKTAGQATALPLEEKNNFTLQHEKISAVLNDNGITWVGTSTGIGIHDSHADIFPFVRVFPDTSQSNAGNIFYVLDREQNNTYYISSYARNSLITMNRQTGESKEIFTVEGKPLRFCTKIIEDSHHRLWVLSAESIFVSDDQKQFSVFPFPKTSNNYRFVDMIEDAEGNFWFASLRHGIFHYNPKNNTWKSLPKDPNALFVDRPTVLLSDPAHDAVWIGDYSFGLFRHDLKTKEYTYYRANTKDPHSIQSSLINSLTIDRQGDVWVATTSGGVSKYSQEKKEFTTYSMETGLPESTIHSMQADVNGNIWLASSKGLTNIKPTGEIIKHYDKNSGLPFSNFSTPFSTNSKGEVIIAAANGFLKFHPDSLTIASPDFSMVITAAKQGEHSLTISESHSFSYDQNEFDFQFSALTYSSPNQVTYFYQLKGYDKDWINAGNNHTAHYTNLSDGEYTFSVKAIDHSGRVSNQPASVSFSITPPFWKSSWFIALIVTAISTVFYLWIRNLQRKIQSQQILNQLATSLFGQNTVDRVFSTIAKACGESLLFENCTIYLLNYERGVLIPKATSHIKTDNQYFLNKPIEIELGHGAVGTVAQTGDAAIRSNLFSEIAAPILIDGKVFAVIAATNPQKYHYDRWHLTMLKEIAEICSVKITRYFAEEQIRSKVARDLHDDLGSTLSSINILSQVALVEKNGNAQNYLQRIGDQSARMMEDMGDMVWSINPRNDSMKQIIIRMREFTTEIVEPKNISYHFSDNVAEELTLDADKRKNLFLIFKETVNNAAKYSNATDVEIKLYQQDQMLILSIKDNGQGFNEQTTKSGNGLRNVRERAKEVNGVVVLKSVLGEGTELELLLPVA
ncbi:MAG: two-component regulator propeller domain-containing protein [Cyclobacteriaceae bacterium]